jgi:hypothetical protein
MTTPRRPSPTTFEEYFQLRYGQACQSLREAEALLERRTLDLKYLRERSRADAAVV